MIIVIDGMALSTEHAASSYGQLVLLDDEGQAYGPGDRLPGDTVTCAERVREVVAEGDAIGKLRMFIGGG